MKRKDAIQQLREFENKLEVEHRKKMAELDVKMNLENRESNYNRARSISVGTAFGGTTEIMMRGDGGRHLWCIMQPVEVMELLHQLASNVGCIADVKPRKDFSTWRDWRVSEPEKRHLQGHPPFVNDMAVFQKLGASGYNDEEAKKIMDIISNAKEFANENDDAEIFLQETKNDGATNLMYSEEDKLAHNKLLLEDEEIVYIAGGNGGDPMKALMEAQKKHETMATNKPTNRRKAK